MGFPHCPPRLDTPLLRPFYAALDQGELRMPACPVCNQFYWYPPHALPCHPEAKPEWRLVSPEATVYMFTQVERSLLPTEQVGELPHVIVLAESDTVPGARIPGVFLSSDGRLPRCDMRVRFRPVDLGDYRIVGFEAFA